MAYLQRLAKSQDDAFYSIHGEKRDGIDAYVVTTPGTRKICNRPEVLGAEFRNYLELAVVYTLTQPKFSEMIHDSGDEATVAWTILRGGLNFRIWEALCHPEVGLNEPLQGFMTSQRKDNKDGTWEIIQNKYKKVHLPEKAVLIAGDIVATGSTLDRGFNDFETLISPDGGRLEHVIIFTIGCENTEEVLARHRNLYKSASVIYVEGRFGLATHETEQSTDMWVLPDTDLLRHPALLTPEFEESQYENEAFLLERCTVYDGGARTFKSFEHRRDVIKHWERIRKLAEQGFTLAEALSQRWPERFETAEEYVAARSDIWKGVPEGEMNHIFARSRVIQDLKQKGTAQRLLQIAQHRIERMRQKRVGDQLMPYDFNSTNGYDFEDKDEKKD